MLDIGHTATLIFIGIFWIILIFVTIANIYYFNRIYNQGGTTYYSQDAAYMLTIFSLLLLLLEIICTIGLFYAITVEVQRSELNHNLELQLEKSRAAILAINSTYSQSSERLSREIQNQLDSQITNVAKIINNKNSVIKKQELELVVSKNSIVELQEENEDLKNKIIEIDNELGDMSDNELGDMSDKSDNEEETNEQNNMNSRNNVNNLNSINSKNNVNNTNSRNNINNVNNFNNVNKESNLESTKLLLPLPKNNTVNSLNRFERSYSNSDNFDV